MLAPQIDILQEDMAQNGFEADIRIPVHQDKERQLQAMRKEQEDLADKLSQYRDLWPRVSLARIRLEKAKEDLEAVRAENKALLSKLGEEAKQAAERPGHGPGGGSA